MPRTGNYFIDNFSLVCIFLPLLPVILIFFRNIFYLETLNLLMILCLLNFIRGVLSLIPGLIIVSQVTICNIFFLAELVILLLVYRSFFPESLRYPYTFFLVAFLSSLITFYFLKGIAQKREYLEVIQEGVLLIFSMMAIIELIGKNDLHIFHTPLFWIALGTIFYFSISLLVKTLGSLSLSQGNSAHAATQLLIDIAAVLRYLFYILAGLFFQKLNGKEKNRSFS